MELTRGEHAAREAAGLRDAGLSRARRRAEGIVHTAPEIARFAVRAADELVRGELGLAAGIADPSVAVIDPACGPGAFLAAALAIGSGRASAPRALCGFDRDRAAIASARAALAPELRRAGWPCTLQVRDTLRAVRPESLAALGGVAVVLGNPPWIGSAQPRPVPWLDALLEDFRRDPAGERLRERKLGVLADAYVRFLRWACELGRLAERGAVLALVTNASYLDGPVHRGLRAALRRFFDRLYVLDLGGNALLARAGKRDDNVFGVRPAAAVLVALRRPAPSAQRLAGVHYLRLTGPLTSKLDRLAHARLADPDWRALDVDAAQQRFVPTAAAREDYASWPSLCDAMPFHREGVQTNRDAVAIDHDRERLLGRLRAFAAGETRPELTPAWRPLPHYRPEIARAAVARALERDPDGGAGLLVRRLAYRPLDDRWFAAVAPLCHRPRPELLAAIGHSSFALVTVRKDRGALPWAHFAASRHAIDNCLLSNRSSCRARAFPTHDPHGRENLSPAIVRAFGARVGSAIGAHDFACYALAVLASPSYRARHQDALRIDYPRIPPPLDAAQWQARCAAGRELVALFCEPLEDGVHASVPAAAPELTLGHHRLWPVKGHRGTSGPVDAGIADLAVQRASALSRRIAALE